MMTALNPCRPPENREICRKLRAGLGRLRDRLRSDLENSFPNDKEQIALALKDAEEAAWITPFPALFFPPLAQLKAEQRIVQA